MLSNELTELANNVCKIKAETQTTEVKAAHNGCPKRLYDTLSSFSNQDAGGVILFGLDEASGFAPVGVYDPQDLQKQVTEQAQQMEPPVRAVFTVAEFCGVTICSAEIPGIDLAVRPCYYRGAGKVRGAYVRVGDADLPMTDYEIYSYEAFRQHLRDDEQPVERAVLNMLDRQKLQEYIDKRTADRPGFSHMTETQMLEMLNITRGGVPTLAAVVNFSVYPQGYFPQLAVTAVSVPGREIGDTAADSARFLDNRRIEGTITEMLEQTLHFCRKNMKVRTVINPETGLRRDRTEYPVSAIREAVLNALIHRDYSAYSEGTPIQVNLFTDRMEIHSPGGLYGRMTVDQLGYARPDLRNPALAVMAETISGAENRYSGIPTIRREMNAYGLPAPVFENRRNEFVVTFYNRSDTGQELIEKSGAKRAGTLLEFCAVPRTRQEITDYLGMQTVFYAMKHYVQPLLASGELRMTIPDKPKSRSQKYVAVQTAAEAEE